MTVTLDARAFDNLSTHRAVFGMLALAAYVTGGLSLVANELKNLGEIEKILFEPATNGSVIILLTYDYTNQKVKAFDMAGAEIANGTDLSAYTAQFVAFGK